MYLADWVNCSFLGWASDNLKTMVGFHPWRDSYRYLKNS
jgi:hypothetical protein